MTYLRLDLHVHTYASGDSTSRPEEILRHAKHAGLDTLAITDHHTLEVAKAMAQSNPFRIIVGEEISTEKGDLIGLFLTERIPQGLKLDRALELIRLQHGLACVPHPGDQKRHSLTLETTRELAANAKVELIEWGNSKNKTPLNSRTSLTAKYPVSYVASSDSHVESAVGSSYTEVEAVLPLTATSLLDCLAGARLIHRHCDPVRPWSPRILPSSPDIQNSP